MAQFGRRLHLLWQASTLHFRSSVAKNRCIREHVCSTGMPSLCSQLLQSIEFGCRHLCTNTRQPVYLVAGSVQSFCEPSPEGGFMSMLHGLSSDEGRAFKISLTACASSQQVLHLIRSSSFLTGAAVSAALHRLADLEQDGSQNLRDPETMFSDEALNKICLKLERDLPELEDDVVVQALLGCTRLYLDPSSQLVRRLVSESQVRLDMGRLSIGTLCELVCALFAIVGLQSDMLIRAMRQIQNKDPAQWNTRELTSVYCMLAAGLGEDRVYQDLLNKMNARALSLTVRMDPPMVSKTLGVLVTLGQSQALPLVIALCKQAVRHVPKFTDTELNVVLSALMHYGHSDHFLIEALERYVPKMAFTAHPETLSKVMQYFGWRRILSPLVFDAVAESFVYRADEYTTEQVSQQIMALGVVRYLPQDSGRLFRKVESLLNARFSNFHPRTLLELLHACTLLQRYPLNFVSKVFSPYFLQQLQDEGGVIDQEVLALLTQLYMTMKLECPFYQGPRLLAKLHVKSFLSSGSYLESQLDPHLYNAVKNSLVDLLGARSYFASRVLTPYCYTLDVEIKLDEEGYVLPTSHEPEDVFRRIALCIDDRKRFAANARQLLGKEAIKQRHLTILGYDVVQIPYYEFEDLKDKVSTIEYLHKKIFPHTYRLSW